MPIERHKTNDPFVMNENTVNMCVARFLVENEFQSVSYKRDKQTGIDVTGYKSDWRVLVESKGSQANNHTENIVSDNSQLWIHVCEQVGQIMKLESKNTDEKAIFVIANPDIPRIRERINYVRFSCYRLGYLFFWVQEDGSVNVEFAPNTNNEVVKLFRKKGNN